MGSKIGFRDDMGTWTKVNPERIVSNGGVKGNIIVKTFEGAIKKPTPRQSSKSAGHKKPPRKNVVVTIHNSERAANQAQQEVLQPAHNLPHAAVNLLMFEAVELVSGISDASEVRQSLLGSLILDSKFTVQALAARTGFSQLQIESRVRALEYLGLVRGLQPADPTALVELAEPADGLGQFVCGADRHAYVDLADVDCLLSESRLRVDVMAPQQFAELAKPIPIWIDESVDDDICVQVVGHPALKVVGCPDVRIAESSLISHMSDVRNLGAALIHDGRKVGSPMSDDLAFLATVLSTTP